MQTGFFFSIEVEDCVSEEAKVDPHGTTGDCVAATPEQVHPFESVLESGDSPLHLGTYNVYDR